MKSRGEERKRGNAGVDVVTGERRWVEETLIIFFLQLMDGEQYALHRRALVVL